MTTATMVLFFAVAATELVNTTHYHDTVLARTPINYEGHLWTKNKRHELSSRMVRTRAIASHSPNSMSCTTSE